MVYALLGLVLYWSTGEPWIEGLSAEAQRAMGIFIVCFVLWVFSLLPLMITSILAIVLPPLLGVISAPEAFALFGNNTIFFLLGAFILAAALQESGLAERVTLGALKLSGGSPKRLCLGIYGTGTGLSLLMSEHAVAAILFPIALELCRVMELKPLRSNLGKLLFLSMAWGCISGGAFTLLGGARAPLAIGILEQTTDVSIAFFEWTIAIWPGVLAMTVISYLLLLVFYPVESTVSTPPDEFIRRRERALGKLSVREQLVGLVMLGTIWAWVFLGHEAGLAEVSLIAVVVLFAMRLITWRQVEESVNWGVLLMYGGAIALGSTLAQTGAAEWMAQRLLESSEMSPGAFIVWLTVAVTFLTEAVSNSAVVSILMPLGLAVAEPLGLDPKTIAYTVATNSGLPHLLPMATPALAMAYSSGYLRVRDGLVAGMIANMFVLICFILMVWLYWPLLGMRVF